MVILVWRMRFLEMRIGYGRNFDILKKFTVRGRRYLDNVYSFTFVYDNISTR